MQTIDQAYNTTANCLKPPSSAPPLCATLQVRRSALASL